MRAMSGQPSGQTVSVSDAARILGVSRRTVDRRIRAGQLSTIVRDGQKLVVLGNTSGAQPVETVSETPVETPPDTVTELVALRTELEAVKGERDHLRQHLDKLTGTVDRLTISLAQLSGTIVDHRALEAGTDTHAEVAASQRPVQRPWWRFWAR